jgi:hypothetical protein
LKKVQWICNKNNSHKWIAEINSRAINKSGCPNCLYKYEQLCREILEELLNKKFLKVRLKLLNGLELDGFCEELKLGFEYQGIQHKKHAIFFHKGIEKFHEQQEG